MKQKYLKPKSLTWWAGIGFLASGAFTAFEPVHGLVDYAASIKALYGNMTPAMLINSGLAIIGLRGAM